MKESLWLVLCDLTEPKDRDINTFQESTRCIFFSIGGFHLTHRHASEKIKSSTIQ